MALSLLGRASGDVASVLEAPSWWRLSDRELMAGVEAAYRMVAQVQTVALSLLGELDARGLGREAGASSTAAWVTATRRVRPQDAKRDVTVARLLHAAVKADRTVDGDPVEGHAVLDGLREGGVNLDQAGVIATALEELPDDATTATRVLAEQLLVDEAGMHGPGALARLGHRIAERVDPDAADRRLAEQLAREEREATRRRSGTRSTDGHGSVCYRFRVPIGDDAFIFPILDTLAAPDPAGPGIGDTDTRTPQQRYADAFVETFRRLARTGDLPSKGGDRPRVLITMGLDQLKAGVGAATMVDTGDQLSPGAVRRLCCDAQVIPVVLGGASQVLDVGRARRTCDGPIRVAVIARDHGCVHPGCPRPARWCDVHHLIPWWAGGPTALHNSALLCPFHHQLYDQGDWQLHIAGDGIPQSIPPPWIDPQRKPRRHERFHERHGP